MSFFVLRNDNVKTNCIEHIQALLTGEKKPWCIEVLTKNQTRSLQQNKLYWKWLTIIGDYTGDTNDELHKRFALEFLGADFQEYKGEKYLRIKSTTELKVGEFADYLNDIEALAMNLGLDLPSPQYYGYDYV